MTNWKKYQIISIRILYKFCALFSIFIILKNNDEKNIVIFFYIGNHNYNIDM
jgi:hypothetical protein